jgi:predicted amino acid racemase
MTRLEINLDALRHNFNVIRGWMEQKQASWCVVTKMLCGDEAVLRALVEMGACSFADSRLANMEALRAICPECETWYLRPPSLSQIHRVVDCCTGSLNSELPTIKALNEEAARQGKRHRIIIMIELGELREGVLPSNLVRFYETVLAMEHIEVVGIGTNIGCLHGAVPTIDQFMQLVLYRELLELKFKVELPWISAGTSVSLPALLKGNLPREINHFRIGESLFLGNDLANRQVLPPLRDDVFELKAEIVELKEKSLTPLGEKADINPFPTIPLESIKPGSRGWRALLAVGHLDCDVRGLRPVEPNQMIAGVSSDLTVLTIQGDPQGIGVGKSIRFRSDYAATLSLMHCRYIDKQVTRGCPARESWSRGFWSRLLQGRCTTADLG